MIYVVFFGCLAILAIGLIWARRIEKRIKPPERLGHEEERFHFKYGSEPPGAGGSGTISGAS
jgi:hypothetical protein